MAKVIQFNVPVRFRKPVKRVLQQQHGQVLEFHAIQKKPA